MQHFPQQFNLAKCATKSVSFIKAYWDEEKVLFFMPKKINHEANPVCIMHIAPVTRAITSFATLTCSN